MINYRQVKGHISVCIKLNSPKFYAVMKCYFLLNEAIHVSADHERQFFRHVKDIWTMPLPLCSHMCFCDRTMFLPDHLSWLHQAKNEGPTVWGKTQTILLQWSWNLYPSIATSRWRNRRASRMSTVSSSRTFQVSKLPVMVKQPPQLTGPFIHHSTLHLKH